MYWKIDDDAHVVKCDSDKACVPVDVAFGGPGAEEKALGLESRFLVEEVNWCLDDMAITMDRKNMSISRRLKP